MDELLLLIAAILLGLLLNFSAAHRPWIKNPLSSMVPDGTYTVAVNTCIDAEGDVIRASARSNPGTPSIVLSKAVTVVGALGLMETPIEHSVDGRTMFLNGGPSDQTDSYPYGHRVPHQEDIVVVIHVRDGKLEVDHINSSNHRTGTGRVSEESTRGGR